MKTFGENLRARRKYWNIQQKEFAKMIGVEVATLLNYEKGKTYPNVLTAYEMAQELDCTIEYLLTGGDNK